VSAAPPVDATAFRRWMGRWPTGVSVVTAREGERDFGLTVNAFLSVSLAPPTVLVSLGHEADSTDVVARTGRYAVNLLAAEQRGLSERFAKAIPPVEKFRGVPIHRGPSGLAWLDGAVGVLDATVTKALEVGDHTLFVGRVDRLELSADRPPLLFHRGQYAEPEGTDLLRLPRPRA
jgi:flavin reductase (DIM6/NTAB) family NADH-FMN oxidoreductase RutF